jgi:hypothetical protein
VLAQSPSLAYDSVEHIKAERVEKQIKQLIKREKTCSMFRRLGVILKGKSSQGLSRIDIPDSSAHNLAFGDPNKLKTWTGPWKTVTNPQDIVKEVCKINAAQYHQAHHTPFGSGPLADLIGRHGDTTSATELLKGHLPDTSDMNLLPETINVLQTLASPCSFPQMSAVISLEDFTRTYKVVHEDTSSSPSGHHTGHYKAVCSNGSLTEMFATMMSLPFQIGFAPDRWKRVTDIMLEKDPGNSRCHRLHIIALFESDFNQAKRIIIGRRITHAMCDHHLIPTMQYGSAPGRQVSGTVLQKVLSHDYIQLMKRLLPS